MEWQKMREITKDSVNAFFKGSKLNKGNMSVNTDIDKYFLNYDKVMKLHGNAIAWIRDGYITISDCGWETVTTKERLNGILDHLSKGYIFQKDFVWYYQPIRGDAKRFNGSLEFKL
jgi:hypothetical protein